MKNLLLILSFLAGPTFSYSQCTPDLSCLAPGATSGYCPASELDTGTVGLPYSDVVSVRVPEDGSDFGQPLTEIQRIEIVSVDSLAPGLSYTCNPPSCEFPGNSEGCILVSGTPTMAWDHKMTVHATAYVKIFFVSTTQPQTLTGFYSVVENVASIAEQQSEGFQLLQNHPNPFSDQTDITFNSANKNEFEFLVNDLSGRIVYSQSIKAEKGLNKISFNAAELSPGAYSYFLQNKQQRSSGKMIILRN